MRFPDSVKNRWYRGIFCFRSLEPCVYPRSCGFMVASIYVRLRSNSWTTAATAIASAGSPAPPPGATATVAGQVVSLIFKWTSRLYGAVSNMVSSIMVQTKDWFIRSFTQIQFCIITAIDKDIYESVFLKFQSHLVKEFLKDSSTRWLQNSSRMVRILWKQPALKFIKNSNWNSAQKSSWLSQKIVDINRSGHDSGIRKK